MTEMTLNGTTQSTGKYNTTKHLQLCALTLTLNRLLCPGRLEANEQMDRISIPCSAGCCSVNGSALIKCSADFCLHLLLIKINEAQKQAQALEFLHAALP